MERATPLYPLKFHPILKTKVWGGDKMNQILQKSDVKNLGESWEISAMEDNISQVSNGSLAGKNLQWLLEIYQNNLVGKKVYQKFGNTFPLLFKFIDAKEDLSVQVHPNDTLAKSRHNSFGKTEMWYILDAEKDSLLVLGFKEDTKKSDYLQSLSENRISEILHSESTRKNDAFVIKPGTVHAIGAGTLLAEIQQTSDITYRIYDWDRPDTNGQLRQLHTELALDAIDFAPFRGKLNYLEKQNFKVPIGETDFFSVNKLVLPKNHLQDLKDISSFVVYMCIEGGAIIEVDNFSEKIRKGETVLIPAQFPEIKFITNSATFLEVYIP